MNDGLDFLNDTLDFLNNSFGAGPASSDSGDGKPVSKNNKVLVVGAKESFLIRVIVKKIQDAGIPCEFAPWEVNDIYSRWKDTGLVTAYMDDGLRPGDDAVRFLTDKLAEEDKKLILVGEKNDVSIMEKNFPVDLIYQTFIRPIDNDKFIATVREFFDEARSGSFKKTILVVDDDPNYLNLVREWLRGKYKVAMANSGMQAIKWLGLNNADLILLDYEMPVTSGAMVLEMLRNDEETRNIPVIFLTGKNDKNSVIAVMQLKPDGYFLKTIERKELLDKLDEFFVLHRS
ncbi:MAG: response regulator [Lachnospiraceae bacterium]|nr:response regulator [Lachnospiraceae bacterium]